MSAAAGANAVPTLRLAGRLGGVSASPMLQLIARTAEMKAAGRDVISMAAGEPDFDTPAHVQDAAIAAMRRGETHYTAADGTRALKEAVARKFRNENGLAFGIDQISVGSGAKQVIFNALAATLDPGDEVIVPIPYYPSYLEITRMCGAVPIVVSCPRNNGFRLLPADLTAAITPRTRWLVLNAPSNPSGAAYSAADLAALAVVLLRHPHVWVLSDDIYEHLLFAAAPFATIAAVEPRLAPRTLTVNGVSKAYCMTGWRVGYAGGPADLIRAMAIVQSQVTSSPCSISQAAACAALDGPQDVVTALRERFRARRDLVVGLLTEARRLECFLPDGAFYAFPSCAATFGRTAPSGRRIEDDHDFAAYLLDAEGVVVVPGSIFGLAGHVRLSYAADDAELAEACRRIGRACAALA